MDMSLANKVGGWIQVKGRVDNLHFFVEHSQTMASPLCRHTCNFSPRFLPRVKHFCWSKVANIMSKSKSHGIPSNYYSINSYHYHCDGNIYSARSWNTRRRMYLIISIEQRRIYDVSQNINDSISSKWNCKDLERKILQPRWSQF